MKSVNGVQKSVLDLIQIILQKIIDKLQTKIICFIPEDLDHLHSHL